MKAEELGVVAVTMQKLVEILLVDQVKVVSRCSFISPKVVLSLTSCHRFSWVMFHPGREISKPLREGAPADTIEPIPEACNENSATEPSDAEYIEPPQEEAHADSCTVDNLQDYVVEDTPIVAGDWVIYTPAPTHPNDEPNAAITAQEFQGQLGPFQVSSAPGDRVYFVVPGYPKPKWRKKKNLSKVVLRK